MSALAAFCRRRLGGISLATWFVGMVMLGAGLLAKHLVPLPTPTDSHRLGAALGTLRRQEDSGSWIAIHVLYSDCRCSQRVATHLTASVRPTGWSELVLWTGDDPADAELERHGFRVKRVTSADLAAYGIEAAPMLVVLDPFDHVRYAGGYTDRKQGPVIDDVRILAEARDAYVPALPVFGCAVSDRLRSDLAVLPSP